MTSAEFTYPSDEWNFGDGSFICADLELTLSVDIDDFHGAQGVKVESVRDCRRSNRVGEAAAPTWLSDAMTAWVGENQDRLRAHYEHEVREAA